MLLFQYIFAPYYTRFLLFSDELTKVKEMKIKVLLGLLNMENYAAILRELIVRPPTFLSTPFVDDRNAFFLTVNNLSFRPCRLLIWNNRIMPMTHQTRSFPPQSQESEPALLKYPNVDLSV